MIVPMWFSVAAFGVAVAALGLAWLLFLRRQTNSSHRSLAALLSATAVIHLSNGWGLIDEPNALFWRRIAMMAEVVQPAALLYAGLAFMKPAEQVEGFPVHWRARIVYLLGVLLALFAMTDSVFQRII